MRRVVSAADLEVACPLCHAQPGQPCVSTGGHGPMPGVIHRERKPRRVLEPTPEQQTALANFLAEFDEVATGSGRHEGHTLEQVGRCVYCSCGFRYQGTILKGRQ